MPDEQEAVAEAKERRHWRAFWDETPPWIKGPLILILGGIAGGSGTALWHPTPARKDDVVLRQLMVKVGSLDAGFKAFVATQTPTTRLKVLEAMNRYEDKSRDIQP